jgi:hypothetical protein
LIFTESKKWVIEFTKDKTLWFNYNIFQGELELIGKDCTEERDLIKNWFESRFLNKPKVWATFNHAIDSNQAVEDTIQNGVKETVSLDYSHIDSVLDTIENGVKETKEDRLFRTIHVMNAIVNGVKHVEDGDWLDQDERIDDIIESGVKEIIPSTFESEEQKDHWKTNDEITESINDVLENGVKETKESMLESSEQIDHQVTNCEITENINDAIENGVKETKEMKHNRNRYHGHFILEDDIPTYIPMVQVQDVIENGVKEVKTIETANATDVIDFIMDHELMDMPEIIDNVIENGVKEVKEISNFSLTSEIFKVNAKRAIRDGVKELKELPDKSGEFRGYGDWYHRQGNMTKPHTEYVKEIIEDSYNHMGRVEGVIRNTDKDGI